MSTALKVDKQGRLKVSEADIEKNVNDVLQLDGWRSFKMEKCFSEKKQRAFGEVGMPDRLFIRYWHDGPLNNLGEPRKGEADLWSMGEILWIEHKSRNGKPSAAQKLWHSNERKRGALTLIAGVDFQASIEGFLEFYRNSGLQRRKM